MDVWSSNAVSRTPSLSGRDHLLEHAVPRAGDDDD
jgi:hypothetical protein